MEKEEDDLKRLKIKRKMVERMNGEEMEEDKGKDKWSEGMMKEIIIEGNLILKIEWVNMMKKKFELYIRRI